MAAYSPSTPREEVDILAAGTAQLQSAQGHEMQAQQDDGDEQLPPVGDEQDEEEEEEEEEQIEEEYGELSLVYSYLYLSLQERRRGARARLAFVVRSSSRSCCSAVC